MTCDGFGAFISGYGEQSGIVPVWGGGGGITAGIEHRITMPLRFNLPTLGQKERCAI